METCIICGRRLEDDEIHSAFGEVHCANCFSESYTYCSCCDELLTRVDKIKNF